MKAGRALFAVAVSWILAGCGGGSDHGFSRMYQTELDPDWDQIPAIFAIRGASAGDVWATGQFGTAFHYASGHWTKGTTASDAGSIASLTGVTAGNAFALDLVYGDTYQWNGTEWATVGVGSDSRFAIWADGPQSIWSHGLAAEHWDGQVWSPVATSNAIFINAMAGIDLGSMFAVGGYGVALHFDGTGWQDVPTGSAIDLHAVWVESATSVWMVGDAGTILHWDGATTTTVDGGTQHDLTAVSGTGPADVWAAGYGGTVIHWDGTAWTYAVTPNGEDINCAWASAPNQLWIGDVSGAIWRYVP